MIPIGRVIFRAEALASTGDFTIGDWIAGQTNAQALAARDRDGDDVLDLAAADFGASRFDILENQL